MKINGSIFDPLRPDRGTTVDRTGNGQSTNAKPKAPAPSSTPKTDSVQISDKGRSLAASAGTDARGGIDQTRVAELRKKVYEGAYNSLDVVDQVARRIISRGDL